MTPFVLPPSSAAALAGIDLSSAQPIGRATREMFDAYDQGAGQRDPSRVKAILRFPSGVILISSKLAIDADGAAAHPGGRDGTDLDEDSGQSQTSFRFPSGTSLSSERHPYFVLPGGGFRDLLNLALGDVAVIVYRGRLASAIAGDIGPSHKFGEASIRVHEALMPAALDPCVARASDGSCRRIRNSSIAQDVVTLIFPQSAFKLMELTPDNAEALITQRAFALFRTLFAPPSAAAPEATILAGDPPPAATIA